MPKETAKVESAKPGHYWNYTTGDSLRLREGESLPAQPEGTRLVRVPAWLLLLLSPALGLCFVIFLPLFTVTMVPVLLLLAVWRAVERSHSAPQPPAATGVVQPSKKKTAEAEEKRETDDRAEAEDGQ